jgi:O-antigen ligase
VGAWRGVFYHKNLAGGVIALAVIFAVDMISREKRWLAGGAFLLLAATALALTGSRTSAVASLLAVIVLLGFRGANALAGDDGTKRVLLHLAIGTAVLSLSAAAWFLSGAASYVADPEAFTGRGVLWREVHTLISSRPLTGWGFESVFQAGDSSPLAQRGGSLWVRAAPHGHNGFLDLLVSIGAVGTLLFAWCFLVQPFRNLARLPYELQRQWSPIIGSLMCFALVHSLMEGRMLAGDSLKYIIFVLLLGLTVRLARTVRD